jgi:GNAT superfamily N-acetyltransferase
MDEPPPDAEVQIREILADDTLLAAPALRALRPHFDSDESIAQQIDGVQRAEGYRLVGAFLPKPRHAVAVAGFRVSTSTAWGRHVYVDDLITLPRARRHGLASRLLEWAAEEGRRQGCEQLHLDSGTIPDRYDAHRLYFASGLVISAHHFARRLAEESP